MDLDLHLRRFRLANRQLYNGFYHPASSGWPLDDALDAFQQVEGLLFHSMVGYPLGLELAPYGTMQPRIRVRVQSAYGAPWHLNRELDSSYWDDPHDRCMPEDELRLMAFCDFDQSAYRDLTYVRVLVVRAPDAPRIEGKHALIEAQYVGFELA
jgi:hypothetical protein